MDLVNLQNYYTAVAKLRAAQNICIDKVIAQLQGGTFHVEQMGITQGEGNYYNPTENNYAGVKNPEIKTKPVLSANQNVTPYQISLSVYNKGIKAQGLKDSMSSSSGGGSGSLADSAAGALATRNQAIASANAKAQAAGYDIAKANKELRDSLRPPSSTGAGSGAGGGAGSASAAAGSGADGNKATLDADSAKKSESESGTKAAGNAGISLPGVGGNSMAGIVGGANSGSSTDSTAALKEDPTGMSDEEKDRMAANYDRTKNQYKPSEEDSLFQVVSKTYVRNLEKVLTRKKKLEDDAASAPSLPSTP